LTRVLFPFQTLLLPPTCWRIKNVSTYNLQAYGPKHSSPRDSLGSCQSAEQEDYKRLIYLYLLTYPNPNLRLN
jgi:hypothetical protein